MPKPFVCKERFSFGQRPRLWVSSSLQAVAPRNGAIFLLAGATSFPIAFSQLFRASRHDYSSKHFIWVAERRKNRRRRCGVLNQSFDSNSVVAVFDSYCLYDSS